MLLYLASVEGRTRVEPGKLKEQMIVAVSVFELHIPEQVVA